jgi:hypothetical protein
MPAIVMQLTNFNGQAKHHSYKYQRLLIKFTGSIQTKNFPQKKATACCGCGFVVLLNDGFY